MSNKAGEVYLRPRDIVYVPKTWIARTARIVDQYVSRIIPHSLGSGFGYSLRHWSGGASCGQYGKHNDSNQHRNSHGGNSRRHHWHQYGRRDDPVARDYGQPFDAHRPGYRVKRSFGQEHAFYRNRARRALDRLVG